MLSTISAQSETIQRLLDLPSEQETKNFQEVMAKSILDQQEKLTELGVSTDTKIQKLMMTLFNKQVGGWKQEIGREINLVI